MKSLDKTLEQIGHNNSAFGQAFGEMNDLSNALKTTNVVADFAKKHLGASRYRSPLTYAIIGYGAKQATGLPYYKALGLTAIPALTLAEGQRMMKIALKSPAFRKYYGDYISNAIRGNVKLAQNAASNLDKVIDHEDKRQD